MALMLNLVRQVLGLPQVITGGGSSHAASLLLETGFYLLLEDGSSTFLLE